MGLKSTEALTRLWRGNRLTTATLTPYERGLVQDELIRLAIEEGKKEGHRESRNTNAA